MSNTSTEKPGTAQSQVPAKTRRQYHAPKMETYGAVSVLTRSGDPVGDPDGIELYTYTSNPQ